MTDAEVKHRAAEMLIVAFVRGYRLLWAALMAMGEKDFTPERMHELAPFMPVNRFVYRMPARAYVEANWPKLAAYLIKHEGGDISKLLAVVPQIERLKWKTDRGRGVIDKKDAIAIYRDRKRMDAVLGANRIARDIQLSTQRGAWNVVKK